MFGFLKLQTTPNDDPLRSPAAASAWLQCLPPEDAAARQLRVLAAVEGVGQKNGVADADRVAAIDFVDAAADADRRRLIAQYIANADRSPAVADALWESIHRLNAGFIAAYRWALDNACTQADRACRNLPIPLLLSAALPVLRHRQQAASVSLPALESGEMDAVAPVLSVGRRARCRRRAVDAGRGGAGCAESDGRTGISCRAPRATDRHGQSRAGRVRLHQRAVAPGCSRSRPRPRAAFATGSLRRHRRPERPRAADGHRSGIDAALPRHGAARGAIAARDRGVGGA